jgi:hypothetical protein
MSRTEKKRAGFEGVTCWADLFGLMRGMAGKGQRLNVYPITLAAILCDAGGGVEVSDKALREACERDVAAGGCDFNMRLSPGGIEIDFPDSLMAGVAIEPKSADPSPQTRICLNEIITRWGEEMGGFCADRQRLGDDARASGVKHAVERLKELLKEAAQS